MAGEGLKDFIVFFLAVVIGYDVIYWLLCLEISVSYIALLIGILTYFSTSRVLILIRIVISCVLGKTVGGGDRRGQTVFFAFVSYNSLHSTTGRGTRHDCTVAAWRRGQSTRYRGCELGRRLFLEEAKEGLLVLAA